MPVPSGAAFPIRMNMNPINRNMLFHAFVQHETVTIDSLKSSLCIESVQNVSHLTFLLEELCGERYIKYFEGVLPDTYTITDHGLTEAKRLQDEGMPVTSRMPS